MSKGQQSRTLIDLSLWIVVHPSWRSLPARFRGEPALSLASYSPTKTILDSTSTPASPLVPTFTNRIEEFRERSKARDWELEKSLRPWTYLPHWAYFFSHICHKDLTQDG